MDEIRQERLVAALGHELRNPLGAALTGVSLVREMVDEGDPRREILDRAVHDLSRVGNLVTSFLEFARARNPKRERISLSALLSGLTRGSSGGNVAVDAGAPDTEVLGDAVLLERVFENLVENAVGVGASHVRVAVRCSGDEAHIEVRDNGPGVAPELRERIFEPSFSGRGSSGLGLAIAAEVVAAHGGRITLDRVGSGATFRVVLPRAVAGNPVANDGVVHAHSAG